MRDPVFGMRRQMRYCEVIGLGEKLRFGTLRDAGDPHEP